MFLDTCFGYFRAAYALIITVTLCGKSSLNLGENKAAFTQRGSHVVIQAWAVGRTSSYRATLKTLLEVHAQSKKKSQFTARGMYIHNDYC